MINKPCSDCTAKDAQIEILEDIAGMSEVWKYNEETLLANAEARRAKIRLKSYHKAVISAPFKLRLVYLFTGVLIHDKE